MAMTYIYTSLHLYMHDGWMYIWICLRCPGAIGGSRVMGTLEPDRGGAPEYILVLLVLVALVVLPA